jgi:hypothetical protein
MAFTRLEPTGVNTQATFTFANANVSGNLNVTGISNLGSAANVKITGGTAGQLLSTDGTGNLSWSVGGGTVSGASGSDTQVQYNHNGNFAGSSNFTFTPASSTLAVTNITANGAGLTSLTGANVTGQVANSLVSGTVYTNAQPNITSVGTLSSLRVTANITSGNVIPNANVTYNLGSPTNRWKDLYLSGTTIYIGDATLSSAGDSISMTGNLTANNASLGNLVTANFFQGNGSLLTSLTGANVTGQVSNSLVSGTVYTNAQPNITSVGTLTSLISSGLITATGGGIKVGNIQDPSGTNTISLVSGNVNMIGNLTIGTNGTGNITATYHIGNGSLLSSITGANVTGQVANSLVSGTVYTNAQPNITSVGTLSSLAVTANITSGNIAGGNLVSASYFSGNASLLTSVAGANVTGQVSYAAVANSVAGGNVGGQVANSLVSGTVYTNAQPNITSVGTLTSLNVTNDVVVGGNLTVNGTTTSINSTIVQIDDLAIVLANDATTTSQANGAGIIINGASANILYISSTNSFTFSHKISADGSLLTSLTGANVSGQVSNSLVSGTVYTNAQPNITSVGTLSSLAVTANITTGNISGANAITANYFIGNGSLLTGLAASYSNANVAAYLPTYTGNITAGNITGGSGSGGTIFGANLVSANYFTGTLTTTAQPNITSVGILSSLAVTGNITAGNVTVTGQLISSVATGTAPLAITSTTVVPNLYVARANVSDYSAVTLQTTGTFYPAMVSGSASGNYILNTDAAISYNAATDTLSVGNLSGTLTTAAQTNITSVGTLTSLTVTGLITATAGGVKVGNIQDPSGTNTISLASGNVTMIGNLSVGTAGTGNVTATYFIGNGSLLTGLPATYSNTNVASYLPTYTGNFTAGNAVITTSITTGNITTGSGTGGNISGANVISANTFIATGNVTAGNIIAGSGSGGSLSGANLISANYFSGAGNLLSNIVGANVTGQVSNSLVTGTVYTNAQPNITSVGSLTGLTISNVTGVVNFITTANVSLGAVGNLHITGGTTGQVLSTDGSGTLSWATLSGSSISNGTSNVNVGTSGGNITVSVGGTSNIAVFASSGTTFTGTTTLQQSTELYAALTGATGTVTHDFTTGAVFYHTTPAANFTPNFTNVPTTDLRIIVITLVINQGATAYLPTASAPNIQIAGVATAVKWVGGATPTGIINSIQTFSYAFLRSGSTWIVTGSTGTYY